MPWCSGMKSMIRRGQPVLARQVDAVLHVRDDDLRARVGIEPRVRVCAFGPVLHEEIRPDRLAHVVVVRANARQQRVCADGLGRALCHVAHDERVVIGAWRLQQELPEQRVRGPRDLEQL